LATQQRSGVIPEHWPSRPSALRTRVNPIRAVGR
jgi:hypothetical protein